ncbi:MAG: hypothetical protein E7569_16150 [Ruminococcaceae bacterium]|uniref:bacteriophage Gp15 family protein n=1 Tax=Faecalispora jeddahensis TaxID=1414721 RepID=UPI00189B4AF8|nr:bacteriophage Gp15 family protein [Faecalispora jeddahensis]MBE6745733.1 hypothetical protein [Oscillospiraceae bacterium]MBS5783810.1 bacteriophage Gp15 family protein [Clostridium sp.]
MSLLTEVSPRSVMIEGQEYEIDADFRNCIRFEQLMFDPDIQDDLRGVLALNLFYPEIPQNVQAAFEHILRLYSAGQGQEQRKASGNSQQKRIYSFEHDSEYIFAAFMADYRIDLNDVEFLHWWKFRALFTGLKPDNLICKIMDYRAADLSKLKGEERKFYQKMQKQYALPVPKAEQEKCNAIAETLLISGDLSGTLSL